MGFSCREINFLRWRKLSVNMYPLLLLILMLLLSFWAISRGFLMLNTHEKVCFLPLKGKKNNNFTNKAYWQIHFLSQGWSFCRHKYSEPPCAIFILTTATYTQSDMRMTLWHWFCCSFMSTAWDECLWAPGTMGTVISTHHTPCKS